MTEPLPDIVARLIARTRPETDEEREHVVRVALEVQRATATTTDEENHDD